ncbi:MAG: hypothetical protein JXQ30_09875 [Spirochaetes bacterium]|nr:hypothetical protein [Spirochaetota bacterium]
MNLKRIFYTAFVLVLLCSGTAATAKDRPKPRQCQPLERHPMQPGTGHGYMEIIDRLAGTDSIKRKYHIENQRVYLDAKQEALDYQEKQQELRRRLFDLARGYDSNPAKNRAEIIDVLEEMQQNQQALEAIQEKAMERIRALHEEERKKIQKAVEAEINKLKTDKDEMKRFVEALQQFFPPPSQMDAPPDDM